MDGQAQKGGETMQTAARNVALVIVSHSRALAEGVRELAAGMGGPGVAIYVAAGTPDGGLGTDTEEVRRTLLQALEAREAAVLLFDLGSAYLSSTAALELLDEPFRERVVIADAPLVEGAIVAAVEAALGKEVGEVKAAAESVRSLKKIT
ncbi:MAG: Phosphoenolpyruvate-dihydroxyacetone phosphotransferase [Hydrogenibacillus schlegelii]|uniref:phosphoenolpyruvate--glycerone phosphotransferase n=2 Tax=Hydrogenibacillus schlegelii TaxID=1484 RepID=A0A2T5GD36_HYDSH|nr:MAG: Phosphoenolpyruvate-dihydroxyacetone phosphotransferase [Hydrogenibacillus schlegelii]